MLLLELFLRGGGFSGDGPQSAGNAGWPLYAPRIESPKIIPAVITAIDTDRNYATMYDMADDKGSKLAQLRALQAAKLERRANPLEDAARGRDLSSGGGVENGPPRRGQERQGRVAREPGSETVQRRVSPTAPPEATSGSGCHQCDEGNPVSKSGRHLIGVTWVDCTRPKRGRPRIGEKRPDRPKPWLALKPPISERTWYRRQAEKKGEGDV